MVGFTTVLTVPIGRDTTYSQSKCQILAPQFCFAMRGSHDQGVQNLPNFRCP